MIDLIAHIDSEITACIGKGKSYGLCRLIIDDKTEHYPAKYDDFKKVVPEDRWSLVWYHRLLDGEPADNETFSFGRHPSVMNAQRIRTVVVSALSLGETLIDDIVNAFPDKIENTDYKVSQVGTSMTLIRDRHAVWEAEWSNSYRDKYQVRYNIYAIEYVLEYIKCTACVTS